jgi:NADPH:quinone reductase-like Zn-dependent oxidoreductase
MKLRYKVAGGLLILVVIALSSLALALSHTAACPATAPVSGTAQRMQAIVYRCYGSPDDTRLGVDFAGTVEAIGKNVSLFKPGDEVFGGANGAFAEYTTTGQDRSEALKPANISFEQAAAVPIAALTALQALRDKGQLQPGQKVLLNGASGGVGTFTVQIARAFGAEVSGVCSTRNIEMVRSIGADHVIDYTRENYMQSRKRYDLIVDMVGNHSLLGNG